jgi:putative solute:sodium symporter small subunit
VQHDSQGYWKATLGLLSRILVIWFACSFGAGILFADALNNMKLGGYPLGFWFAHQGSIYIFIALIFYYAKKMGDIDRQFDVKRSEPKIMDLQTTIYLVVGLSFALYIGIAIWARAGSTSEFYAAGGSVPR